MSVILVDDPSYYNSTQLATRWSLFGSISLQAATGRFGTPCWRYTSGGNAIFRSVPLVATGTIAVSLFFETLSGTTPQQIISFVDSVANLTQCCLWFDSGGHLNVSRGTTSGTVLATSTNSLSANVWYRIEFKLTVNSSSGSIEVRVNGTSTGWIPPTSSLNTQNSSNANFNQVSLFHFQGAVNPSNPVRANDYVFTDSNTPNANFLGDKRCFLVLPAADSSVSWTPTFATFLNSHGYVAGETFTDGTNIQRCTVPGTSQSTGSPTWASTGGVTTTSGGATFAVVGSGSNPGVHNWMAVSEIPSDGDSSYNADATPGDIDLFTMTTLPGAAANIVAVNNVLYSRKDDAGTRTQSSAIKSGGTTVLSAAAGLSTSYAYIDFIQETDPNTSAPWTASGVNAATMGYKEVV